MQNLLLKTLLRLKILQRGILRILLLCFYHLYSISFLLYLHQWFSDLLSSFDFLEHHSHRFWRFLYTLLSRPWLLLSDDFLTDIHTTSITDGGWRLLNKILSGNGLMLVRYPLIQRIKDVSHICIFLIGRLQTLLVCYQRHLVFSGINDLKFFLWGCVLNLVKFL